MKKTLLFGLALAGAATAPAQAQVTGTHAGVLLGGVSSVLDGQINAKGFYKTGFTAGGVLRYRPSRGFALQPELLYAQEGTGNGLTPGSSSADYDLRLHYLTLPIMAKVYIGRLVNVQAGPQVGLLLSAWQVGRIYTGSNSTVDREVSDTYASFNFALCGGIGVDLPFGLLAQARLNYGLADVNADADEAKFRQHYDFGGLHTRSFSFSLGYLFAAKREN